MTDGEQLTQASDREIEERHWCIGRAFEYARTVHSMPTPRELPKEPFIDTFEHFVTGRFEHNPYVDFGDHVHRSSEPAEVEQETSQQTLGSVVQ
jgi:hypothetical protein